MSERDLNARLDAVERALTDGDADLADLREASEAVEDLRDLESRLADLESRVDELEAGLQAVRGYAGNVRAVNREVERRASAALAKAETLEAAVEAERAPADGGADSPPSNRAADGDIREGESSERPGRPTTRRASADRDGAAPRSGSEGSPSAGRAETATERRTGDPVEDQSRDASGGESPGGQPPENRRRDASAEASVDGRAGWADEFGDPAEPESSGEDSQTEQFIERVRDAL